MVFEKEISLKDSNTVTISQVTKGESFPETIDFINALVTEGALILKDSPLDPGEDKWLKEEEKLREQDLMITLKATCNSQIIAIAHARRGIFREKGNIEISIMVSNGWRWKGIGNIILKELITLTKKQWKPKNISLKVAGDNTSAIRFYESLGFNITARLPNWVPTKKGYCDLIIMVYEE